MKHLENVPTFICKEGDYNFCSYIDTDSNYFHAEPLLKHMYPKWNEFSEDERINVLEKLAFYYQNYITTFYDKFAKDCFNIDSHRFEMKTEVVIRSAYFRKTRRYAQWILKEEGKNKDKLDVKGLEFKKANFPKVFNEFFSGVLEKVLKGANQESITKEIMEVKNKVINSDFSLIEIANPTSVKKIDDYVGEAPKEGEIFTKHKKNTKSPVAGAIRYNDLLKFWKLDKKYNYITRADKVKWVYLKDNPYKINSLSFLHYEMPPKIEEFIEMYIDREKVFETILFDKLDNFFDDLGWKLNLNPHVNKFFSIEI